ncbi:MAG TPA: carboxypeptidase-like regulatory domain-containing protein [Gillisia sp.]|nr:carboxypeptidase-like regulatory domain-containing protein [Gillisia sp.]
MKQSFIITFLFFSLNSLFSQESSISGKVLSLENNTPLPYVNIGIPNKSLGTVSNEDGYFSIKLPKEIRQKDTLVFSYIGYDSKRFALADLKNTSNWEIILEPAENLLQEVVLENKKFKEKRLGRTTKGLG